MPAGSYLALSHLAKDIFPAEMAAFVRAVNEQAQEKAVLRDRGEVARFLAGLDLIPPGVVQISKWHPRSDLEGGRPGCAVGRHRAEAASRPVKRPGRRGMTGRAASRESAKRRRDREI